MTTLADHATVLPTSHAPIIYARPGTTGSIVPLKTRYENFIGGEWLKPVKGGYAEDLAPATGLAIAEYARSTVEEDLRLPRPRCSGGSDGPGGRLQG